MLATPVICARTAASAVRQRRHYDLDLLLGNCEGMIQVVIDEFAAGVNRPRERVCENVREQDANHVGSLGGGRSSSLFRWIAIPGCRHSGNVLPAPWGWMLGASIAPGVNGTLRERIQSMARIRRILFASDFSTASRKAFTTAVAMAKTNRATLTILHVIVPFTPIVPEQYINTQTWDRIDREARGWSRRQLDRLTDNARKAGIRAAGLLLEGDPAQQILRGVRLRRAELLVVGTHGRTGLTKFFVGSVAGRVVATASCPVVTVRSK
jgi:nucleotide-binding universal stress UspA family protein